MHVFCMHQWAAPLKGWIKLNTDTSFSGENRPGGAGAVVKNSEGRVSIAAYCPLSGFHNDEDTQARSALMGVKLLEGLGHEKVIQTATQLSRRSALSSWIDLLCGTRMIKQRFCRRVRLGSV
jgi:ribonuclease HI